MELVQNKVLLNREFTAGAKRDNSEFYSFAASRTAGFKFDLKVRVGKKKDGTPSAPYVAFSFPGETKPRIMSFSPAAGLLVKAGDNVGDGNFQLCVVEKKKGERSGDAVLTEDSVFYMITRVGEAINLV